MDTKIGPPETESLRQEAVVLFERVQKIAVTTNEEYEAASRELVRITTIRRNIIRAFEDPKSKQFEAHRAICKLEQDLLRIPAEAERMLKGAIGTYYAAEQRKRREKELELQAHLKRQEEDRRMSEAEALAKTGHQAEAEKLLDEPVTAPVVTLPKPAAPGISTRKKWTYRVTNPADHKREYLALDEMKVRKIVAALGYDAQALVGGIVVEEEQIVAVRAEA